ncbi:MAG: hypothetical protein KBC81_02705 [Candidatus Pacebacteria bacterium]|nr:hypothetical protein [Candidatus Paceibacterota bacterium]
MTGASSGNVKSFSGLVRGQSRPFKPFSFYQKKKDRIVVIGRECGTYCEVQITDGLTLLCDNDSPSNDPRFIGCIVCGARNFCSRNSILLADGQVDIHWILDRMALASEDKVIGSRIFTARTFVYELGTDTRVQM